MQAPGVLEEHQGSAVIASEREHMLNIEPSMRLLRRADAGSNGALDPGPEFFVDVLPVLERTLQHLVPPADWE
jgi:hypothetical protein